MRASGAFGSSEVAALASVGSARACGQAAAIAAQGDGVSWMSMRSRLRVPAVRAGAKCCRALRARAVCTGAVYVSVIGAGVIGAGVICAVMSAGPAMAAECLGAPNRDAPAGSHWYFHVDRTADRKCWYLHATAAAPEPPTGAVEPTEPPVVRPALRPMPRQAQAAGGARPPMSESDEAALYLEFLRWREQQRGAQ
jgi:hypothetical protein